MHKLLPGKEAGKVTCHTQESFVSVPPVLAAGPVERCVVGAHSSITAASTPSARSSVMPPWPPPHRTPVPSSRRGRHSARAAAGGIRLVASRAAAQLWRHQQPHTGSLQPICGPHALASGPHITRCPPEPPATPSRSQDGPQNVPQGAETASHQVAPTRPVPAAQTPSQEAGSQPRQPTATTDAGAHEKRPAQALSWTRTRR